jgi:hypothetical protein
MVHSRPLLDGGKTLQEPRGKGKDVGHRKGRVETQLLSPEQILHKAEEIYNEVVQGIHGQEGVKKSLRDFARSVACNLIRKKHLQAPCDITFPHTILAGPPGTGKTTLAEAIGVLIERLRRLDDDCRKFTTKSVQYSQLTAGYVGQSDKQTDKLLNAIEPGLLFIDEAYRLSEATATGHSDKDYGKEVLETIMNAMTDGRDIVFIFAGCLQRGDGEVPLQREQGFKPADPEHHNPPELLARRSRSYIRQAFPEGCPRPGLVIEGSEGQEEQGQKSSKTCRRCDGR